LITRGPGYTYAAWFGQRLQACRHIDAVAENIVVGVDQHIPDIDADAIKHLPVIWKIAVAAGHHRLYLDCVIDSFHDTWKLQKKAVARTAHDASAMPRTYLIGNLPMRL